MIPSAFVELDQMPLTPNGKVDRKNLPAPGSKRGPVETSQQPDSALHKILADIWKKLLKVEHVGLDDNFFDLGGHSLLTIKLMRQIEANTGEHQRQRHDHGSRSGPYDQEFAPAQSLYSAAQQEVHADRAGDRHEVATIERRRFRLSRPSRERTK